MGAPGARRAGGPTRARPPRHQKSADLDVLSGSSSSGSATEEEGSSNTQRFSLRHVPAFVGSSGDEEEWQAHRKKHVLGSNRASINKQLKPPTPQDGGSNPSPQITDTARISSSSFGEGRESRSGSQDHQLTPLTNWIDDSSWEVVRESGVACRQQVPADYRLQPMVTGRGLPENVCGLAGRLCEYCMYVVSLAHACLENKCVQQNI